MTWLRRAVPSNFRTRAARPRVSLLDVPASVARLYTVTDAREATARAEGFAVGATLMSYVHLHFGSHPALAANFVGACRR